MYLARDRTLEAVEDLRRTFAAARPFPHVVIENALAVQPAELVPSFPDPDWDGWHRFRDEYQRAKLSCSDVEAIPDALRRLIAELNGPAFLRFLEGVSGTRGLLTDPYLEGGGLHCSGPGGVLAPHTDFHLYPRLGIYRRLNLLLYLNERWEESWGGRLELYGRADRPPERVVAPRWGTCVIFRTDDRSLHGFSRPIVGDHWRRSLALYYYTAGEAERYSGDNNTYWRQERQRGVTRVARQRLYRGLILGSRALGFLAHRVDPKLMRPRDGEEPAGGGP